MKVCAKKLKKAGPQLTMSELILVISFLMTMGVEILPANVCKKSFHGSVQLLPKLNRETPEQARFVMLGIKRAQEQQSSFSSWETESGLVIETSRCSWHI